MNSEALYYYRELSEAETLTPLAVGSRIAIYWDGDDEYYPCRVTTILDGPHHKYTVLYEEDETDLQYEEDLEKSKYLIWSGTDEQYAKERLTAWTKILKQQSEQEEDEKRVATVAPPSKPASSQRMSYQTMVVEAVSGLADRHGSSIVAIRKYIQSNFQLQRQQTASFNSLTLKALQKCVALEILEFDRRLYRLSDKDKSARKERERMLRAAQLSASHDDNGYRKSGSSSLQYSKSSVAAMAAGGDPLLLSFYGTAVGNNKSLRKELINMRSKRDEFLAGRLNLLEPFLLPKKSKHDEEVAVTEVIVQTEGDIDVDNNEDNDIEDNDIAVDDSSQLLVDVDEEYLRAAMKCHGSPFTESHAMSNSCSAVSGSQVDPRRKKKSDPSSEVVEEDKGLNKEDKGLNEEDKGSIEEDKGSIEEEKGPIEALLDGGDVIDEARVVYSTMQDVQLVEQPAILKAQLHEHQIEGISWMVHMFQHGVPMILGDQMGLGKTLQSIGFLAYLHSRLNKKGPYLIVVPLSVLSNWLAEIERFCPSFRAVRFHGPKSERTRIKEEEIHDLREFDIIVTTYEILVSEANFFKRKYVWTVVIIDEGHRLKNERSQFSEKLRAVTCLSKVILTGTPLQNNLRELWAMLFYLSPDVFSSSQPFEEGFDLSRGYIDSHTLRKARKLLSVFMLRRLKENVAIKLPSRRELTVLVPLTQQQQHLYRQMLCSLDSQTLEIVMRDTSSTTTDAAAALLEPSDCSLPNDSAESPVDPPPPHASSSSAGQDTDWRQLMNLLLQLRKVCNHTYLLPDVAPEPYEVNEDIVRGSGKLMMLDRMLPLLREDAHRVLIFSQFTSMLDLLEDYCELRAYPFVRLDGETNRVRRRLDVRRFNAPGSPLFIFLISTRAGGLGLNLASADTVILYDSDWNPQVDLQAMERAHRIGQTKPVRVYRLVCGGSVEERMVSRAEKKLFLNAMVAEVDPDEHLQEADGLSSDARQQAELSEALGIGGTSISKGELASLIRFGANAVIETAEHSHLNSEISDQELYKLLERQGRDVPFSSHTDSALDPDYYPHNDNDSGGLDALEKAQISLRDRMNLLKEVDLRQLGSVFYDKRKRKSTGNADIDIIICANDLNSMVEGKRIRKERIVMVDGKGSGYGNSVPILSENIEKQSGSGVVDTSTVATLRRSRQWSHQEFCVLCGINPANDHIQTKSAAHGSRVLLSECDMTPLKCAHCPFIFHSSCIAPPQNTNDGFKNKKTTADIPRTTGTFICPHHRCCLCNRSTASAGGLLFRCIGCLTSYCEDCLPQDEIESIGRCRQLELLGYESKQSYYIRCPMCCQSDGLKPLGILTDKDAASSADALIGGESKQQLYSQVIVLRHEENSNSSTAFNRTVTTVSSANNILEPTVIETDIDEAIIPLKTQLMRLHWEEIIPKPPVPKAASKRMMKSSSVVTEELGNVADSEYGFLFSEIQSWRDLADDSSDGVISSSSTCSLSEALSALLGSPLVIALHKIKSRIVDEAADDDNGDLSDPRMTIHMQSAYSLICNKVDCGRYRTSAQFFSDVRYVIESTVFKAITGRMQKRVHGRELALVQELLALILSFLQELQQKVVV